MGQPELVQQQHIIIRA